MVADVTTVRTEQVGGADSVLGDDQIRSFVHDRLAGASLDGRRVCVLVPDRTRTCPVPLLVEAVHEALHGRVSALTVLVALGTHAYLSPEELAGHFGADPDELHTRFPDTRILNHEWSDPDTFATVGRIDASRVDELSDGRLQVDVDVRVNREVVDHDVTLIVGPVFPHEVVGFSGGNKYLFPGVSGPEMIDLSHWLGALITSEEVIGTRGTTPVRALVDEAAALVRTNKLALCVVTASGGGLRAVTFGGSHEAWAAAADISAESHITYLDAPVRRVLSLVPERYDDLWTGAKGFYKVEPVVADGGQVVIHAPHIREISVMHPGIAEIGYHSRDYFVGQWERFEHHPWGELAHSTHLRGAGTWDPRSGESNRVTVTLATAIAEDVVRAVNLDHLDPDEIDIEAWRSDPDTLVVDDAGEQLYRLR